MQRSPARPVLIVFLAGALLTLKADARAEDVKAPTSSLVVHADRPGPKVSPTLWGIFFEDINCSADGGIYAEQVRNRSLEDAVSPEHWSVVGGPHGVQAVVDSSRPISAKNPHALKVTIEDPGAGRAGVANDGFWGIAAHKGESYALSLQARTEPGFTGPLKVALESKTGTVLASRTVSDLSTDWKPFHCTLVPSETDPHARLVLSTTSRGTFYLDMVSLFPAKTWKDHPNGLRPDLAEMLADLRPTFVRFPGGCWVEGETMKYAYRWKETIGDPSERRTQYNIWRYHATHGLGFHEYMLMCEDLKAEPLFVINCGMSHREVVPMDKMAEFVQDALDAIEYCNGPADSRWGQVRARNGHPEPFRLKYLEIGNENGGPPYQDRYALFHDAIKTRYPQMVLISNVPTDKRPADIVDEHYYSTPEFFIQQAERYDQYDRKGPRIYVGEYAVTQGCGLGNLRGAVGEAAFMVGMERNADIVAMSSYAPLFVNVNHRGWNPDLINFDGTRAYGIPSYYVQKIFSENTGDTIVPVDVQAPSFQPSPGAGAVGVGTWSTQAEFKDLKVTRDGQTLWTADLDKGVSGWKLLGGDWKVEQGALRQNAREENIRAVAGERSWTDYTFSLKARKLGGAEGFLILFHVQDENQKCWWNIGGWGNSRHAVEIGGEVGRSVPGHIETGRWYDIRVELSGQRIRCYLDGALVHDVKPPTMRSLHASVTRVSATGELILKAVNASEQDLSTEIQLRGQAAVTSPARVTVLSSERPTDENTLDQPTRVAPFSREIKVPAPTFRHAFPANSVTVMRITTR